MALASSAIRRRRSSKRPMAPEKVKAIIRPSRPKTAPSTAPEPGVGTLGILRGPPLPEAAAQLEEDQDPEKQPGRE